MSESLKEQIKADLNIARTAGEFRAERIKAIVQSALSQTSAELEAGTKETAPVAKELLSSVIEAFVEIKDAAQSEVSAAIEGAIEAIETSKRAEISQTQGKIKQLQAQVDTEETQLQEDVRSILTDIQETNRDQPTSVRSAIQAAIDQLQETDEITLMRKRYAQLKSQLAVVQAYLLDRYGDRYQAEVTEYLEDARDWYQRAKNEPAFFTEKVERQWNQFEMKLASLGTAIARKERQDKKRLLELWRSLAESPQNNETEE